MDYVKTISFETERENLYSFNLTLKNGQVFTGHVEDPKDERGLQHIEWDDNTPEEYDTAEDEMLKALDIYCFEKKSGSTIEEAKKILQENGYVIQFWTLSDINGAAKQLGYTLTGAELIRVVDNLENIDCNIGINWDSIHEMIHLIKN